MNSIVLKPMLACTVASLILASSQPSPSLESSLFGRSASVNGIRFYARAVDNMATRSDIAQLSNSLVSSSKQPPPTEKQISDLNFVLALIKQGSSLPIDTSCFLNNLPKGYNMIAEPGHRSMAFGAGIKAITKATVRVAESQAERGQTAKAAANLRTILTCSANFKSGSLILTFIGMAMDSIALAAFDRILPRLDACQLRATIEIATSLESVAPYQMAVRRETDYANLIVPLLLQDLKTVPKIAAKDIDYPELEKALSYFRKQSHRKRASYEAEGRKANSLLSNWITNQMSVPENAWNLKTVTLPKGLSFDPVLEHLTSALGVSSFAPDLLIGVAKNRTRFRLLRLESMIYLHKVRHGSFPKSLADLNAKKEIFDPLSGQNFSYRLEGISFELYSKGRKETGLIYLHPSGKR